MKGVRGQARFLKFLFMVVTVWAATASPSASAQTSLEQIVVVPAANLPEQFHAEIDLLFVYDAALINTLPFTQFEWVSSRSHYLQNPTEGLELLSLSVTAESALESYQLDSSQQNASAVLIFASHADPVAEAVDVTYETAIELRIETYGINVVSNAGITP